MVACKKGRNGESTRNEEKDLERKKRRGAKKDGCEGRKKEEGSKRIGNKTYLMVIKRKVSFLVLAVV